MKYTENVYGAYNLLSDTLRNKKKNNNDESQEIPILHH
jgi:hypothetical protein